MKQRVHYSTCPACGSERIENNFSVKDFTVSGEFFELVTCQHCTLRFTQDIPDEASISPYYKSEDYISHTNTSKGLINRVYHQVRKKTLVEKRKLIVKNTGLAKGRLLDVGSGIGSFVNEMKESGWDVTGVEPDADARKVALEQYGLELQGSDSIYKLTGKFDAITLWHVIEHVHDLHAYILQLKSLLSERGRIFIAVPNYTSYDAKVFKDYWAAYDVPRHLYHFSPHSMKVLTEKNGMQIMKYLPMWYDSFYISLLSTKYRTGSMKWLPAIWTGLVSNLKAIGKPRLCSSVIYVISDRR